MHTLAPALFAGALAALLGLAAVPLARRALAGAASEVREEVAAVLPEASQALPHLALILGSGLIGTALGAAYGWDPALLWLVPLAPWAVLLGRVDARTRLLPTRLVVPGYLIALLPMVAVAAVAARVDDLARAVAVAAISLALYWLPWRINARWMGFGDVRLSGALGLLLGWTGWGVSLLGIYLPFLLGGLVGGGLALWRRRAGDTIPLGPFMLLGALVGVLSGA